MSIMELMSWRLVICPYRRLAIGNLPIPPGTWQKARGKGECFMRGVHAESKKVQHQQCTTPWRDVWNTTSRWRTCLRSKKVTDCNGTRLGQDDSQPVLRILLKQQLRRRGRRCRRGRRRRRGRWTAWQLATRCQGIWAGRTPFYHICFLWLLKMRND